MKVAFDVDVLAKQMSIKDMVYKVADWGYKYIEQSPHPRINPFYKHPLFSKECEAEYRQALKDTGVEISSFIVVYRWSGPTEEQRQHAVANWKKIIEIAVSQHGRSGHQHRVLRRSQPAGDLQRHVVPLHGRAPSHHREGRPPCRSAVPPLRFLRAQ